MNRVAAAANAVCCVALGRLWVTDPDRMWIPAVAAVLIMLAAIWWQAAAAPEQCDARVHRDFTDEDIRCQLPAGHAAHRNGTREWTP